MSVRAPKALLIDLDGTLYHGGRMIDGADKLIVRLREIGLPYLFVTNNSSASAADFAARLRGMGIPAEEADVCTSAQAAAAYAAERWPGGRAMVVGERGLSEAVRDAGLVVTDERSDVVLQGIDRQFTYARAAGAVSAIRSGAAFVMTNPDLLLPSDSGLVPGAGAIGAMLRAASGVEPTIIGKPHEPLMRYALGRLGVDAADAVVVGDNPATDIAAGKNSGCGTILVLTGIASRSNYESLCEKAAVRPDAVCEDLPGLAVLLEDIIGNADYTS